MAKLFPDKPETVPVRDLLCDYSHIQIPDYQRHYTWESDNVVQFFEDIIYDVNQFYDKKRSSVFGTIIGMLDPVAGKEGSQRTRDHIFTIIDGQQRISTLNMFIMCLIHFADKYSREDPTLTYELGRMRNYVIKDETVSQPEPRIIFNYNDSEYWAKLIDGVYNRQSKTCGRLRETLNDLDLHIKKENNETKLHVALRTMVDTLGNYLNRSQTPSQRILLLWNWINSTDFGMRFTKIVEHDIHTALMRFDRENNRGVRVTMDDLTKSYLIEAVERSNDSETTKMSKKLKILDYWKDFQKNSKGLNKEKIIQWYLGMRTGYWGISGPSSNAGRTLIAKIFRQNLDINPLGKRPETGKEPWDPIQIASEISDWVKTYQEIIKNREMTHEKTYYNVMFIRELSSPWPFLVALATACQKDTPMEAETSEICNLPMELVAELEYYIITQVLTKTYKQNKWADKYRVWAGWLGRHTFDLDYGMVRLRTTKKVTQEGPYNGNTIDYMIDAILRDMRNFNKKIAGENYADFKYFLDSYQAGALTGNLSGGQFDHRKKAAHIRILKQAEYSLSKEKVSNLLDNKKKGLHLEHIFPNDIKNWQMDKNYSEAEILELGAYKQHLGNHTLVSERFNIVMGNRKFKEKQYGKKSDDGKQNQECYVNSALKITSSLGNQDVQKWNSDIIKRRGEALFLLWAKNGPRIISKEIGRKDKQKTAILEPMANSLENVTIYGLLNSDESSTLEFKRAYFDDRGGDVKLGKVTKLIARTNATINAFANTNGGDLILGKQDTSSDADDVLGINKTINYFENKAVEAGKNKSHGRELFINGLSKSIRSFYKSKRYPIKFVTKLVLLRNEKWVAHINVEKYEDDNGPVPYFHPSKDTSSDVNSGVFFIRHAAESVPYPHNKPKPTENKRNPAKEQIFIINEDYKDNSKDSVLGPFKSASTADNYIKRLYNQSCIDETNIPSRSRRKNISFANRADLEIICDGMFKTPGLKYEDSNGRRACWIVNLVNLPKKWDMDYEIKRPGYTPGSIAHLLK